MACSILDTHHNDALHNATQENGIQHTQNLVYVTHNG